MSARFLVPERIQASAMDCGPSCLASVLQGYGINASVEELRALCQTQADGTSIDDVEEVAKRLGLEAEQVLVPADWLTLPDTKLLPAIVVVRNAQELTHFVVVWSRVRGRYQVMDPARGRVWLSEAELLDTLYVHEMDVPAEGFEEWARSDDFLDSLRGAAGRLSAGNADRWMRGLQSEAGSFGDRAARLDGAVRLAGQLRRHGGLTSDPEVGRLVERLGLSEGRPPEEISQVPDAFRFARPSPEDAEDVRLRGAVLVRLDGRTSAADDSGATSAFGATADVPWFKHVFDVARTQDLGFLSAGLGVGVVGTIAQLIVLRAALNTDGPVSTPFGPVGWIWAALALALLLLLTELSVASATLRWGRRFEFTLRRKILQKRASLDDDYFRTRLLSDLVDRAHRLDRLHDLPLLFVEVLRTVTTLLVTGSILCWLYPNSAWIVLLTVAVGVAIPLLAHRWLSELDLRVRAHSAGLARFYLDAMLGLMPIRAHGCEAQVRHEHEARTAAWSRAATASLEFGVWAQAVGAAIPYIGVGALLWRAAQLPDGAAALLLTAYWGVQLALLSDRLAALNRAIPQGRSSLLRAVEPLGAKDDSAFVSGNDASPGMGSGVGNDTDLDILHRGDGRSHTSAIGLQLKDVGVVLGGQEVLGPITLSVPPGARIGIVGPSGSGKSTLLSVVLGLQNTQTGEIRVDGEPMQGSAVRRLREETVWMDPQVHLFDESLADNVSLGSAERTLHRTAAALREAELDELIDRLPEGTESALGEGGTRVSGGEGQRVRMARGFHRRDCRLVLLDEAGRGLDPELRQRLRARIRQRFPEATWIEATHDPEEVMDLQSVVFLENGRPVELGDPRVLQEQGGAFAAWLQSMRRLDEEYRSSRWTRRRLDHGRLVDQGRLGETADSDPRGSRS